MGEPLGLDFELGTKLAGSRFTVMKGQLARLHRALAAFMLDVQTQQHGYTECYVPYIVSEQSLRGTGQLPKFEEDLFAAQKGGQGGGQGESVPLYLIPTSEVPLTNFVRHLVLAPRDLPIKPNAHTPCLPPAAGRLGRDTPRLAPPQPSSPRLCGWAGPRARLGGHRRADGDKLQGPDRG